MEFTEFVIKIYKVLIFVQLELCFSRLHASDSRFQYIVPYNSHISKKEMGKKILLLIFCLAFI